MPIPANSAWTDNSLIDLEKDELASGDWVDKVIVNKLESGFRDDDDFFCPIYSPDMRKEVSGLDIHRSRYDYDSDDSSEIATSSISSEVDMHYQSSLPNAMTNIGAKSKLKKPTGRMMKNPATR